MQTSDHLQNKSILCNEKNNFTYTEATGFSNILISSIQPLDLSILLQKTKCKNYHMNFTSLIWCRTMWHLKEEIYSSFSDSSIWQFILINVFLYKIQFCLRFLHLKSRICSSSNTLPIVSVISTPAVIIPEVSSYFWF